jgi:hypothetical protein
MRDEGRREESSVAGIFDAGDENRYELIGFVAQFFESGWFYSSAFGEENSAVDRARLASRKCAPREVSLRASCRLNIIASECVGSDAASFKIRSAYLFKRTLKSSGYLCRAGTRDLSFCPHPSAFFLMR